MTQAPLSAGPGRPSPAWPWAAILVLSATLRFFHLGREALWTDEYLTLMTASKPDLASFWENLRARDPHPPLYFFMMYGWVRAGWTGDAALRIPSALFGTTAPVFFYAMLRGLFPERRIAICGGLLMALSPMAIWYAQEARSYGLLIALETGSLAALAWDWKRSGARCGRLGIAASALAVLALWTHFFGGLLWAVVVGGMLARKIVPERERVPNGSLWRDPIWLASLAILLFGAAWPVAAAIGNVRSGAGIDWLPKSYTSRLWINVMQAQWLGPWFTPLIPVLQCATLLGAAALMLAGCFFLVRDALRDRSAFPAAFILISGLAILFILPVAVSFRHPIVFYGQRYMIVALPVTLALGSVAAMRGARAWRWLAGFLLIAAVAAQGAYLRAYFGHRHKHAWDKAAEWLAEQNNEGVPVFVYPPYVAGLFDRYDPKRGHAIPVMDWNRTKETLGSANGGCWIVTYDDIRPWLGANGFAAEPPIGVFETAYPPTRLCLTRIRPKGAS